MLSSSPLCVDQELAWGRGSVFAWTKSWHRGKGSVCSAWPLTSGEKKTAGIRCSGWVEASSGDSWQF